jgi:hypothetical protein
VTGPSLQERLIDIVDRLTATHPVVTRDDCACRVCRTFGGPHREDHDGLIPQLRASIVSSIGASGAGSSSGGSASPFDEDAWQKYNAIERAVGDLRPDRVPGAYPEQDLREWRTWFLARNDVTETAIADQLRILRGWEFMILDKFDPPRRPSLWNTPCPICGFDWWVDRRDLENIRRRVALTITYRPGDLARSSADCSFCAAVGDPRGHWEGLQAIHELAWDIDNNVQYGPDDHR